MKPFEFNNRYTIGLTDDAHKALKDATKSLKVTQSHVLSVLLEEFCDPEKLRPFMESVYAEKLTSQKSLSRARSLLASLSPSERATVLAKLAGEDVVQEAVEINLPVIEFPVVMGNPPVESIVLNADPVTEEVKNNGPVTVEELEKMLAEIIEG